MRVAALALKTFEAVDGTAANLQGLLGEFCERTGFSDVRLTANVSTIFRHRRDAPRHSARHWSIRL